MHNKKILILSTYPLKNPSHGGQKRTYAIYEAYKRNFGQVRHSAVFFKGFYSDYEADDIPLSPASELLVMRSPLTGDIVCGEAIYRDHIVKRRMIALLNALKPDIIHIEQPFPYLGLKPLLAELGINPKLVFGSQNIEAPMKREILEGINVPEKQVQLIESQIADLEHELSKNSDLVVACTEADAKVHGSLGAKHVVLAPNGIARIKTNAGSRAHWQRTFAALGIDKTVLFVGSAHPPNWTGFLDMIGKGLGFVPYNARIVPAGSISDYFNREIKGDSLDIEDATFWLRAYSAGRLSEESLGALIEQGEVIVLPITEGGGSNLKTAEAILADKKVVTTEHALRSYEWFREFPNVWVANTRKTFQRSIAEALDAPKQPRTEEQQKQARLVEWQYRLAAMIEGVKAL